MDLTPDEKSQEAGRASPLQRLRTYRSDVAESLKSGKQSLARMVIAEKTREVRAGNVESAGERETFFTKKNLFIAGGILCIIAAAGIALFTFMGSREDDVTAPLTVFAWSPIFTEADTNVLLERIDKDEIKNKIEQIKKRAVVPINAILHVVFTKSAMSAGGAREAPVAAREFLSAFPHDVPEQLSRALNEQFFYGFHFFRTVAPVLILQNKFYDGAFVGMLQWERFMLHDIAPIFFINPNTGTRRSFEDVIIKNIDVRVLKGGDGTPALLYSFIDRETIVITTNTDTFEEVVTRLRTPSPITQ